MQCSRNAFQDLYSSILKQTEAATGVFYINTLLKNSLYLNRSLFFKRRLQHRCFLVNIAKFLRTPFLQKASGRLLVNRSLLFQELVLQVLTFIIENCMNITFLKSINRIS